MNEYLVVLYLRFPVFYDRYPDLCSTVPEISRFIREIPGSWQYCTWGFPFSMTDTRIFAVLYLRFPVFYERYPDLDSSVPEISRFLREIPGSWQLCTWGFPFSTTDTRILTVLYLRFPVFYDRYPDLDSTVPEVSRFLRQIPWSWQFCTWGFPLSTTGTRILTVMYLRFPVFYDRYLDLDSSVPGVFRFLRQIPGSWQACSPFITGLYVNCAIIFFSLFIYYILDPVR